MSGSRCSQARLAEELLRQAWLRIAAASHSDLVASVGFGPGHCCCASRAFGRIACFMFQQTAALTCHIVPVRDSVSLSATLSPCLAASLTAGQ